MNGIALVFDNYPAFMAWGQYEAALVHALTAPRVNNRHNLPVLPLLLQLADVAKLRAAGDALPVELPHVVYRGVAGRGAARRVRGYSWTLDLDRAKWFATRLDLHDPAVFAVEATEETLAFYTDGRNEQECFLVLPRPSDFVFVDEAPPLPRVRRVWKP